MKLTAQDVLERDPERAETARPRDQTVRDDLQFLQAWENGLLPRPLVASDVCRVRQLRRASLALENEGEEPQAGGDGGFCWPATV